MARDTRAYQDFLVVLCSAMCDEGSHFWRCDTPGEQRAGASSHQKLKGGDVLQVWGGGGDGANELGGA